MNRYITYVILLVLTWVGVSCTDDTYKSGNIIPAGQEYKVKVRLKTADFHVTRSLTEDQEALITNVWVAQFDASGTLVKTQFSSYSEDTPLHIDVISGGSDEQKLYFVANLEDMINNPFGTVNTTTENDFLNSSFTYDKLVLSDKLVMMGVCKTVLNGSSISTSDLLVYVDKLAAKLELVVQVNLNKFVGFQNKKFSVDKVQIGAVAQEMTMQAPVNGVGGSKVSDATKVSDLPAIEFTEPDPSSTTNLLIYKVPVCYMLENMQGNLGNENAKEKNSHAPKDTQNSEEKDIATYITIFASMDNGSQKGEVKYKIYLGKDDHASFDIERNTHYKVTVTLTGNLPTDTEVDVRIDTDKVAFLQLFKPDGTPATNRGGENIHVAFDCEYWDGGGYFVDSGTEEWRFEVTAGSAWAGLIYEKSSGMTSTSSIAGDGGIPRGKFQIIMLPNSTALSRTATIKFYTTKNGIEVERQWQITQAPNTNFISHPKTVYIEGKAGNYAIPIRAAAGVEWKAVSVTENSAFITIVDHVSSTGTAVGATGSVSDGNGLIIVSATINNSTVNLPNDRANTLKITYTPPGGNPTDATINIRQLSMNILGNEIYNFQPSTAPAYEEVILGRANLPWAMNDLQKKYLENKSLLPDLTSRIDGKGNTYKLYETFERDMIVNMPKGGYTMAGFTAFTPAGACAMFDNANFNPNNGGINSSNDLGWYLPANHEGIWTTTTGLFFLGTNDIRSRTFWSSTTDNNGYAESHSSYRYSSYTMGHVDIALIPLGFTGGSAYIRCVRRKAPPALTYPYMKIINEKPVIVVQENNQGYITPSAADGQILTSTRVAYPLRFTQQNSDGSPAFGLDGIGPIKPSENTLAPKFQVACSDAVSSSEWLFGSGWNEESNNWAEPKTGCMAYREGRYTDWRMPTNAELRLMLLMGAGNAELPENPGSDVFSAVPGFSFMTGNYWTGRDYVSGSESGARVYYLAVSSSGNITGSANYKTSTYKTRCVRDIK